MWNKISARVVLTVALLALAMPSAHQALPAHLTRMGGTNLFWALTGCTVNTASGIWGYLNALSTLDPLQNNGGPTWTHALLGGSSAINGEDPARVVLTQTPFRSLPTSVARHGWWVRAET